MFIKELFLNLTYFKEEIDDTRAWNEKALKELSSFGNQLLVGIEYYRTIADRILQEGRRVFRRELDHCEKQIKALLADLLYDVIGTSVASQESVVVSFALAQQVAIGDMTAFEALCMAASLGGDTDTIAAILGAMLGACLGFESWPVAMIEQVKAVNDLKLESLVQGLLALRY